MHVPFSDIGFYLHYCSSINNDRSAVRLNSKQAQKICANDSPRVGLGMETSSVREVRERVVFSEDAAKLAVCGFDGEVKVWSTATGTMTSRFIPEGARGVAIASATWSRVSVKLFTLSECLSAVTPLSLTFLATIYLTSAYINANLVRR